MPLAALLAAVAPQWARLRLDMLTITDDQIVVDLSSTARTARCPDCQRRSHRAHSHFRRALTDLPWANCQSVCACMRGGFAA